jgi:RNA polymerase sigma factor (TIGR02999 family)
MAGTLAKQKPDFLPAPTMSHEHQSKPDPAVTLLLEQVAAGDSRAAGELLPLVYDELRKLAGSRLAKERANMTLQPTALVHEAYMRLVGSADVRWNGRGHFFGAAALAMRRILVERARQRAQIKRGGGLGRVDLTQDVVATEEPDATEMLALDDALDRLKAYDPRKAEIVMLRFFSGLTVEEVGASLGLSVSQVKTDWAYARAWLHRELFKGAATGDGA